LIHKVVSHYTPSAHIQIPVPPGMPSSLQGFVDDDERLQGPELSEIDEL
jgi:hypothetical protein